VQETAAGAEATCGAHGERAADLSAEAGVMTCGTDVADAVCELALDAVGTAAILLPVAAQLSLRGKTYSALSMIMIMISCIR
jgi:hypothetical protein